MTAMNGQNLYNRYRAIMLDLGCGVDGWEELDDTDREAWSLLAAGLA